MPIFTGPDGPAAVAVVLWAMTVTFIMGFLVYAWATRFRRDWDQLLEAPPTNPGGFDPLD